MNKKLKLLLIILAIVSGTLAIAYYGFLSIDFIEHNPTIVGDRLEGENTTILSAEYKNEKGY